MFHKFKQFKSFYEFTCFYDNSGYKIPDQDCKDKMKKVQELIRQKNYEWKCEIDDRNDFFCVVKYKVKS